MGKVVPRTASTRRIKDAVTKALASARACGGAVQGIAEARLAEPVAGLEDNEQKLADARAKDEAAHAALIARDEESDLEIGAVCDEMWNAMGRPAQSVEYDLIVSGGTKIWTEGDPSQQPTVMAVLAASIRSTKHPKLVDCKESWAARIEQRAAAQAEAAAIAGPAYARVTALSMQRRTLADRAQLALTRFKRDLKNLGMTEAQVHAIIPDTPDSPTSSPASPPTSSATPGPEPVADAANSGA
jgi:hypothetical protein